MPTFPKPKFAYSFDPDEEIQRLRQHKQDRGIPRKTQDRMLLATWNLCNFGAQERLDNHLKITAEVLSWFDVVALQEVRGNFADLTKVQLLLGDKWRLLFSDPAGNDERMAFVYDSSRVRLLELIGEVAYPVSALKRVKLKGITQKFEGFDRSPYIVTFGAGKISFLLANVHLYYGTMNTAAQKKKSMERRALETFAVALWAHDRSKSTFAYTRDIVALGDFNMPKRDSTDSIYKALTAKGLHLPEFSTAMGSNLAGDAAYDQIAFFPGDTEADFTGNHGVFDFDKVLFPDLWDNGKGKKKFTSYIKYYLSDHRPMWMEFKTA
jgi:endonuclease/exonuclease/phosphatase family metal-dependent hydrolase